ncbi:MAG: hypothetical protein IBX55_20595 [Methyloprofundus sp.]|nr:hypothetical protein [Methyloprofundus sp.]
MLELIKDHFEKGGNITELLKKDDINTTEAIEIAYDFQAGSYIKGVKENWGLWQEQVAEKASVLSELITPETTLLDCGTGEVTTLVGILNNISIKKAFAFDVSVSRLLKGSGFVTDNLKPHTNLDIFLAEIENIPLANNSIDIVMTSHALEPNHGRESIILDQIFRVASKYVVLFEPCYEEANEEVKSRMDKLGYVRGLDDYFSERGHQVVKRFPLQVIHNQLNPTWCWVIKLDTPLDNPNNDEECYICPKTGHTLSYRADLNVYWSEKGMYGYPVVGGIPLLRAKHAIVMVRP